MDGQLGVHACRVVAGEVALELVPAWGEVEHDPAERTRVDAVPTAWAEGAGRLTDAAGLGDLVVRADCPLADLMPVRKGKDNELVDEAAPCWRPAARPSPPAPTRGC